MTFTQNQIEQKVTDIVSTILTVRGSPLALSNEQSLTEAGMDSAGMVNLLLLIEEAFQIEVPSKEVNLRNFFSIQSIARLIERSISVTT